MKTFLALLSLSLSIPATFASVPVTPTTLGSVLPEVEGMEWQYESQAVPVGDPDDAPQAGAYEFTVVSIRQTRSGTIFAVREHDDYTGKFRFSNWEVTRQSVKIRDVEYPGPAAEATAGSILEFFKLPLTLGQRYDDGQWVTRTVAKEELTIPGVAQPQTAWKLSVIGTQNDHYTVVGDYWLVPGWGIAQSHLNIGGWIVDSKVTKRIAPKRTM